MLAEVQFGSTTIYQVHPSFYTATCSFCPKPNKDRMTLLGSLRLIVAHDGLIVEHNEATSYGLIVVN